MSKLDTKLIVAYLNMPYKHLVGDCEEQQGMMGDQPAPGHYPESRTSRIQNVTGDVIL
jgi:hypothetical protein